MISTQKQFLFIHVPKTGGNSIQRNLLRYADDRMQARQRGQDGIERFGTTHPIYGTTKHEPMWRYRELLKSTDFECLFKFATLRNPWDLMISMYFSPHRGIDAWNRGEFKKLIDATKSFRWYLKSPLSEAATQEVSAVHDDVLLQELDFVLRFEKLNEDYASLCNRIGVPATILPKVNQSTREAYQTYYDDELIEMVAIKFAETIRCGKYSFK